MAEFKLPDLGDGITGGNVIGVLVAVGDTIKLNQDIIELETDKATVTVPASMEGKVTAIHIKAGDTVKMGQLVFTLEGGSGAGQIDTPTLLVAAPPPPPAPPPPTPAPPPPAVSSGPLEFHVPELGDGITGGNVVSLLVEIGQEIKEGQDVLEMETDKATVTVPSTVAGKITAIHATVGNRITIGQLVLTVTGVGAAIPVAPVAPTPPTPVAAPATPLVDTTGRVQTEATERLLPTFTSDPVARTIPAAPNARRLAREIGLDVKDIPPGASGRINLNDIKAHARQRNQALVSSAPSTPVATAPSVVTSLPAPIPTAAPAPVSGSVVKPLPDFSKWGEIEVEKMSGIRRATSNQMAYAWSVAPRVTQFDKADIEELEAMRKKYGSRLEKSGAKLTVTAILLKVTAAALKQFPKFNASIDVEREQVILKKYYHVGVAVDTPHGLVVPVIRDVDRKNIFELAVELGQIGVKARDRKLTLDEMQGGCFTISNLGGIGGTNFTPIVNAPEVAILGVSRGSIEPVYNGTAFEPRLMMPLSLSYDHRLIDGAEGARFLRWICQALENPMLMSLQAW